MTAPASIPSTPPSTVAGLAIVLDDPVRGVRLDLTVAPGRTLAVVGPNGAGKSTLLQTIAGLYVPPSAHVSIGGRVLTDTSSGEMVPAHRRAVGLLEQQPVLFGHLTCLGNAAFGPRSVGTARRPARRAAQGWLDAVGAGTLAHRRPGALSGGQAQRVALARALAAAPDVLLLDEPFAAVDQPSVPRLRRVVADVLRGLTAVIVTHDLDDVLALADDVVVIERGRVVEHGPVSDVLGVRHSAFLSGMPWLDVADPLETPDSAAERDPAQASSGPADRAQGRLEPVTPSQHGDAAGRHDGSSSHDHALPHAHGSGHSHDVDRPRTVADHTARIEWLVGPALASRGDISVPLADLLAADARTAVLARDAVSTLPSPAFENSQMDGYALRASDVVGASSDEPVTLRVVEPVPAGTVPPDLAPGTAAPIMTGAPVPVGADAVLRVEDADPARFVAPGEVLRVRDPLAEGTFVRRTGSDLPRGAVVLAAGTRLGPAQLGALVGAGVAEVTVLRAPHVLVVSTGSELAAPGASLPPGHVPDVNGVTLAAALREVGARVTVATVPDDDAALTAVLAGAPDDVDLVVTSGGVSAGAYEVVRQTLSGTGTGPDIGTGAGTSGGVATGSGGVWFGHVAMQPGGPQGAGTVAVGSAAVGSAVHGSDGAGSTAAGDPREVPIVAFPGNPVSTLVSFETFLRPVVARACGVPQADRPRRTAVLAEPLDSPPHLHQVRRGAWDEDGRVRMVGGPGSHLLTQYAAARLLVQVPVGVRHLDAGDEVEVWEIA